MVSKGGFLNLLQGEVLLLAPGQELQVFCSLPGAVGSFGSRELLLTPVLWVRKLLNGESFPYAQVTEKKMSWSLKSAVSCVVQSG